MTREQIKQILDNSILTMSDENEWIWSDNTYRFGRTTIVLEENSLSCFFFHGTHLISICNFFYYQISSMSIKKTNKKNIEIWISQNVYYISK